MWFLFVLHKFSLKCLSVISECPLSWIVKQFSSDEDFRELLDLPSTHRGDGRYGVQSYNPLWDKILLQLDLPDELQPPRPEHAAIMAGIYSHSGPFILPSRSEHIDITAGTYGYHALSIQPPRPEHTTIKNISYRHHGLNMETHFDSFLTF